MSSPRGVVLAMTLALASVLSLACFDTEADEESSTEGVDHEALLSDVSEVRDLFAERSPFSADLIADVSYEENQLDVTLAEDAEGVEQAEQVCRDLSEAIQLPDLTIRVHGPDDAELATCEFDA